MRFPYRQNFSSYDARSVGLPMLTRLSAQLDNGVVNVRNEAGLVVLAFAAFTDWQIGFRKMCKRNLSSWINDPTKTLAA